MIEAVYITLGLICVVGVVGAGRALYNLGQLHGLQRARAMVMAMRKELDI